MPSGTFLPPGITTSNVKISTGGSDNQVLTAVDGETAQGEANLTFDGSTLTVTGDAVVANGNGAVIGHTAQVTTNVVPEFQILGAGQEDSYMLIGRWQNNAYGPAIQIVKSRDPAIADGSFAIVQDDDQIGDIQFRVDDGTDYQNISAQWYAEVDDGSPAANDVGAAFVWKQQPGGGGSLQETMRIAANGMMTYGGGVSRDTGIVFDNGGTDYHVGIDQTADDLVIGTGTTLGSNIGLSVDSALNIGIGTTPLPANSQVYMNMPATSRSATTAFYRLFIDNGTAITQTTNAASHIGTVSIDEPNITLASSGTVTNAFTLRVTGAPTEGTNNYALWVDDGATRLEGPVTISTAGHPLIAQTSTRWGGVYLEDTSGNNMFSVYPDDADLGGTIMTLYDADTAKIVFDTNPVTLQVGHADAEDVRILFDGAEQDYYMGIDDGDNFFKIGAGSTVGTTPFLRIGASGTYAYGMVIGGTNVSSGVSDTATGVAFMPHITSHSGDDKSISLVRIGGELAGQSMTTGGNTDIATSLHLSEPNISTSHTIDASATLYIKDAASEATTDYALWVDDGTTRLDGTLTMNEQNITHVGNIYADNYAGDVDSDTYMNMAGSNVINFYTGGGKSLTIEGSTTSAITVGSAAAADTRVIFDGAAQDGCIGMDDSTDSLTIQLGSTLGHSTNPHIALRPADGGASTQGHYIAEAHAGTFTSDGSSTVVIGASFGHDLVAANGDTSYHTIVQMGGWAGGSVTTQGNSETIPVISTLMLTEPTITVGSGDTVTASATLWINGEATEATSDYALLVDSGTSRFDGVCLHYDGVQLGYNGTNTGEDLLAYGDTSGYFMWWDASANSLLLGDSANGQMTSGITINQGAADDEILTFKSSDVAHGMTSNTETDTFAYFVKASGAEGGLGIQGVTEVTTALALTGRGVTDNTTKGTGASPYVRIQASKKSGTSSGAVGSDANILGIFNHATCRFIFDAEGSAHADVEWTTYDTYDDLAVIEDMEGELLSREEEAQTSRRKMLEKTGIIGEGSWHMEDGKPRAMINMNKLSMLHHGALIQANDRIKQLETRLLALEGGK